MKNQEKLGETNKRMRKERTNITGKKRILSLLLAVALMLSLIPAAVIAADTQLSTGVVAIDEMEDLDNLPQHGNQPEYETGEDYSYDIYGNEDEKVSGDDNYYTGDEEDKDNGDYDANSYKSEDQDEYEDGQYEDSQDEAYADATFSVITGSYDAIASYREDLVAAIGFAPLDGSEFRIGLTEGFSIYGSAIIIPAGANIVLLGSTAPTVGLSEGIQPFENGEQTVLVQTMFHQRHFRVDGTLTLENIILRGDVNNLPDTHFHGGVQVHGNGTLIMNENSIIEYSRARHVPHLAEINNAVDQAGFAGGGGVQVRDNAELIMNFNSSIRNNVAGTGGGVQLLESGGLIMNDMSAIEDNVALIGVAGGGGGGGLNVRWTTGLYLNNPLALPDNIVIMNDHSAIRRNVAMYNGGGVSFLCANSANSASLTIVPVAAGSFIMNGGEISDNEALGFVSSNAQFNGFGGGVNMEAPVRFEMFEGALITRNTARQGGGGISSIRTPTLVATHSERFDITPLIMHDGSEISFNRAGHNPIRQDKSGGGGIQLATNFIMYGGRIVHNESLGGGGAGGVFMGFIGQTNLGGMHPPHGAQSFIMYDGQINYNIAHAGTGTSNRGGGGVVLDGGIGRVSPGTGWPNNVHAIIDEPMPLVFEMRGGEIAYNRCYITSQQNAAGGVSLGGGTSGSGAGRASGPARNIMIIGGGPGTARIHGNTTVGWGGGIVLSAVANAGFATGTNPASDAAIAAGDIHGQSLTILDGAEITNNSSGVNGGGILIWNHTGTIHFSGSRNHVVMYGGLIEGNYAGRLGGAGRSGGGILLMTGTGNPHPNSMNSFDFHGGQIINNGFDADGIIRTDRGGGVFINGIAAFNATGRYPSEISGNLVTDDGGGIWASTWQSSRVLSLTDNSFLIPTLGVSQRVVPYSNLYIHESVVFDANYAGGGWMVPPINPDITQIAFPLSGPSYYSTGSYGLLPTDHTLNNFDINFAAFLDIEKQVSPTVAQVNDPVTYTITVRNPLERTFRSVDMEDIQIRDLIDITRLDVDESSISVNGLPIASNYTIDFNPSTGLLVVDVDVLPAVNAANYGAGGAPLYYYFTITFTATALSNGTIENDAFLYIPALLRGATETQFVRRGTDTAIVTVGADDTDPAFTITFHPYTPYFHTRLWDMFDDVSTGIVNGRPVVTVTVVPGAARTTWQGNTLLTETLSLVGNAYYMPNAPAHAFWGWFTDEGLDPTNTGRALTQYGFRRPALGSRCVVDAACTIAPPPLGTIGMLERISNATTAAEINAIFGANSYENGGNLDLYGVWALWGDVNDDDTVDLYDLDLFRRYLTMPILGTAINRRAANVVVDGSVDLTDLQQLRCLF